MRFWAILCALGALLLFDAAAAQNAVVDVLNIPALRSVTVGSGPNPDVVNVQAHYSAGDGGGGTFVLKPGACATPDDDGVVIQDNDIHNCWYRQFSGPVHLAWYGLPDAVNG